MPPTEQMRQRLEAIRKSHAEQREAEDAILMPPRTLARFRRQHGISQTDLASRLSQMSGKTITQNHISNLEREKQPDRTLQLILSKYFLSLGYEVDKVGNSIHIVQTKI